MNEIVSDRDLLYRYPDEKELSAWFRSLPDHIQMNLDLEYESKVPDWYDFLRRIRYERFENRNNNN